MLACRPPESGGKKTAGQSKPFTVAEMRALAERLVGADLCFVEGEFASDLFQWLESAEAWVDAANCSWMLCAVIFSVEEFVLNGFFFSISSGSFS
jgi:hypothetical protein